MGFGASPVWQAMFALLGAAGGLAGCPNDSESAGWTPNGAW